MIIYYRETCMILTWYQWNVFLFVIFLWCIPWWVYNRFIRTKDFHPMGQIKFPTPRWMSCAIPVVSRNPKKNNCENVKLDGWSIGHVLIYASLGMVLPGYWVLVLVTSVLCEVFEYAVGWRARWIMDPLANLFGYGMGHLYFLDVSGVAWMHEPRLALALTFMLGGVLYLNRPSMLPRGNEFY